MAAYNFKPQFVAPIRSGRKHHTIRGDRKRHARPGEPMQLYTGQRTKMCIKIIPDPICTKVQQIAIVPETVTGQGRVAVFVDDEELDASERESLALHDGFDNFVQMMRFWEGRLPFVGKIIHWRPTDAGNDG